MGSKYGVISFILAASGILLFYFSSFGNKGIFNIYFFIGIAFWMISLALGVKGIKTKENGVLKYFGMGIISLTVIGYLSLIAVMGITGFGA